MTTTVITTAQELQAAVDALLAVPVQGLLPVELQDRISAVAPQVDRLEGWVQALSARLQTAADGQVAAQDGGSRSVVGWLAQARRTSPGTASSLVRRTLALQRDMPLVAAAVLDGTVTPEQAGVLSRLVGNIPKANLAECQQEVLRVAKTLNPSDLAAWVRHLIATHCEPQLEADAQTGRNKRYLQWRRNPDGSLRGTFVMPGEDSETFLTALEPLARPAGTVDQRSAGQRRCDALTDLAEQVLRHGDLPDAGGRRPQLSYVLPADWATRQAEQLACTACGPRCREHQPLRFRDTVAASLPGQSGAVPAEHACAVAAWTGPQTRARVETMICAARITRVLLDAVGQVKGLESLHDNITATQRQALIGRDLGCAARGCARPPAMCDAHHLEHRADGGDTTIHNLVLLCRRHHVLWHLGKLQLRDLHAPWHPDNHPARAGPPG